MKSVIARAGVWALSFAVPLGACHGTAPRPPAARAPIEPATKPSVAKANSETPAPRPLRRCFPEQPAWVDAPVAALHERPTGALPVDRKSRLV